MSELTGWDPTLDNRVVLLEELIDQLDSKSITLEFCTMRCTDIMNAENIHAHNGQTIDSNVMSVLLRLVERNVITDLTTFHELLLTSLLNYFATLRSSNVDATQSREFQKKFDAFIDVISENQTVWPVLVKRLYEEHKNLLELLIAFRFITLKRSANLLNELQRWNLESTIGMQLFLDLLELIRPRVRSTVTKFVGVDNQNDNRFKAWSEMNEVDIQLFGEQLKKYADEIRFTVIQPIVDASKFQTWDLRDYMMFSAEWIRNSDDRWKRMFFKRISDKVKAEIELSGLLISPEKVTQWFRTYAEKVKGIFDGDATWLKAVQARVQAYYLFEDSMNDMTLKRIKWIATQTEHDFEDDERAAEAKQKYHMISKLNDVYAFLEDANNHPNPEEIYKPKQDEELRKTIQQHIKNQVTSRRVELTKHRRIVTLAFYNNGKYDVKGLFHFVNEQKKNNREYLNFITWLYGDKTIISALDSSSQRELKNQIEWYIEMEVVPEMDQNSLKILLECEHSNIKKIVQGE
jgi:hypothetical protein